MALKDTDDAKPETEDADVSLDMSQAAVKKMIADARERGYITYDQLNTVLPPEQVSSEQIEDVMSMLSEMGINIIEDEEVEEGEAPAAGELVETSTSREIAVAGTTTETLDRTDDPVRMYLREMGSVELLSREGEIAIAKRIEAGRDEMIGGLCESPLTIRAILKWHDELKNGRRLLRDIVDLEATQGGGSAAANGAAPAMNGDASAPTTIAEAEADADATPPPGEFDGEPDGTWSVWILEEDQVATAQTALARFERIALYRQNIKRRNCIAVLVRKQGEHRKKI